MQPREKPPLLEKEKSEDPKPPEDASSACPRCGGSEFVGNNGSGETVCASCGLVVRDRSFVANPRWADSDGSGAGGPVGTGAPETPALHDKGLSTVISPKDRDGRGNPLSSKERALARKLRKWQKRCRVSGDGERNLAIALGELDRMASQLGVPESTKETASRIYREAADEGLVKGRSIEGVSSAALYAACKDRRLPRTMDEVSSLTGVGDRKTRRAYRALTENLDLNLPPLNAVRYVRRFGDRLDLPRKAQSKAVDVVRRACDEGLVSGRSPSTTAVAALYIAAALDNEEITQRKAKDAINVPQQTVSERHRQIARGLGIDLKFRSWVLTPVKDEATSRKGKGRVEDEFGQTSLEGFGDNGILWWIPVLLERESKSQREAEDASDTTERDDQERLEKFAAL